MIIKEVRLLVVRTTYSSQLVLSTLTVGLTAVTPFVIDGGLIKQFKIVREVGQLD